MSRKDYYAVGEIMTRKNGKKYECVEKDGCLGCDFFKKGENWCDGMKCAYQTRIDCINIVFIRRKDLEQN